MPNTHPTDPASATAAAIRTEQAIMDAPKKKRRTKAEQAADLLAKDFARVESIAVDAAELAAGLKGAV